MKYHQTCYPKIVIFLIAAVCLPMAGPARRSAAQESLLSEGPPLSIAFSSQRDGNDEIYVMNSDGSGQENVTEDPASDITPDISPNGRLIVFASNRITEENPEGDYEIFIMSSDGEVLQQVTHNSTRDSWPRWSPNGRTIVFEGQQTSAATSWEIYTYTLGDDDPVRLTDNGVLDRFPEWSPDGKLLVIRRVSDLHLIDHNGSHVAQLTYDVPPAGSGFPPAPNLDQMGSFSPDGKHVAWMSLRNGYPSVFVLHLDQPEIQTELTPKPGEIPASAFVSRAPAWSRNGKYIFFTRREPGTNGEEIYVMNYDGTGVSPLTGAIGNDSEAAVR